MDAFASAYLWGAVALLRTAVLLVLLPVEVLAFR
jgi:hypothetical protein